MSVWSTGLRFDHRPLLHIKPVSVPCFLSVFQLLLFNKDKMPKRKKKVNKGKKLTLRPTHQISSRAFSHMSLPSSEMEFTQLSVEIMGLDLWSHDNSWLSMVVIMRSERGQCNPDRTISPRGPLVVVLVHWTDSWKLLIFFFLITLMDIMLLLKSGD